MGRNNYFIFKQFTVSQEHSAMKVGVDSVLLGAWTNPRNEEPVLDVGTGTGLLALMMAQKTNAMITAVEIDEMAAAEAAQNVRLSPWPDRIRVVHSSFQEFAASATRQFGLIVSNPPYFINSSHPEDIRRKKARHNDDLPFNDLLKGCAKLLTGTGSFNVILPADIAERFVEMALKTGLYLTRSTWVKHSQEKPYHRRLMEFSLTPTETIESFLVIMTGNEFTEDYKLLTADYYLAF
ncbi:MAG: tRNA1(Val) (adenine(37)-N6)-methyltransferase [Bacteroidota bacterium]